jgi:hypothetical protein
MQPYFLPYIGYFQLISAVDTFVVYDNIQYTKKGWINRNRYLLNGKADQFSIALKKDSDYLHVADRYISDTFDRNKLLNRLTSAYRKAPHLEETIILLKEVIYFDEINLFDYIYHSITTICDYIGITTKLVKSSSIDIDHSLKSEKKVIAICKAMNAETYINAIGGIELYSSDSFSKEGIKLGFIKPNLIEYQQFDNNFVPWLSIVDLFMFNCKADVQKHINSYGLL